MHFLLLICVQHSDSWLVLHTQLFLTNNTSRPSKSEKINIVHFVANKSEMQFSPSLIEYIIYHDTNAIVHFYFITPPTPKHT